MATREFDVVLMGATGFTGGLTADYLARNAPEGLRWALAGRNTAKLEAVRSRLAGIDPALADLALIAADSTDHRSLDALAARTAVLATAVGPYLSHGAALVGACAEAGTDYLDLTGEPEFVDRTYVDHHATAERTGARLVHACGFDSIPHDLGAWFTVQQLSPDLPITMRGVVRAAGTVSGGTFHSAVTAFSRSREMKAASSDRRRVEGRPVGRSSRAVRARPRRDPDLGYWLLPLPTIDPLVVARSGAALPAYGPRFRYSHFAGVKTLRYAAGGVGAVGLLGVAAQVGPLRSRLLDRLQPGQGPSESRRATSWFTVDFVGETEDRRVHTRVSGGDPGYDETAKMLAEAALCLALDDNPPTAGQVTPAQAMATHLLPRLEGAGLRFEVVSAT